jgi:hypothetical protein
MRTFRAGRAWGFHGRSGLWLLRGLNNKAIGIHRNIFIADDECMSFKNDSKIIFAHCQKLDGITQKNVNKRLCKKYIWFENGGKN